MLNLYDLYDLHAVFVAIRSFPNDEVNSDVVSQVLAVLKKRFENSEFNQFRKAIRSVNLIEERSIYDFVFVENKYSYFPLPFLKSERIYKLLIEACEELLRVIKAKQEQQIVCLADCLHNLPIVVAENNYTIPKSYWKKEIRDYRTKWNEKFLIEVERNKEDGSIVLSG